MTNEELKMIDNALREARYFARNVRDYIFSVERQRPLTKEEEKIWWKTHDVHIHTNDAELILNKYVKENEDDF